MKKLALILFFLAFCFQSYSQVSFEKAYFVDNDNIRTECFIKNKDLYNNPISFEYKLNEDESTVKVGDINRVKEFGILNGTSTAKSILKQDVGDLVRRTDLEEETILDVMRILKEEFES